MREICLQLAQPLAFLFGTLAVGYVTHQRQGEGTTAVPELADANLDREHGRILSAVRSLEGANLPDLEPRSDPLAKRRVCTRVEVTRRHPDQFLTSVAE